MGRHGKNIIATPSRGIPLAKPITREEAVVEFALNNMKLKGYEEGKSDGINQAFLAGARALIYDYDDMKDFETRLKTYHGRFCRYLEVIRADKVPDFETRFAAYLLQEQAPVQFNFDSLGDVIMKPYAKELGEIIKKYITDNGATGEVIRTKLSISKAEWNNALYNGQPKKAVFDKIIKHLGLALSKVEQNYYNECFADNRKRMEAEKKRLMTEAEELQEPVVESVSVKEEVVIPVPEELPELVEAVIANDDQAEEVPFSDCNEMYKEAVVPPAVAKPSEMLRQQLDCWRVEQQQIRKEEEEHLRIAELLKQKADELGLKFAKLQDTLRSVEELGL